MAQEIAGMCVGAPVPKRNRLNPEQCRPPDWRCTDCAA